VGVKRSKLKQNARLSWELQLIAVGPSANGTKDRRLYQFYLFLLMIKDVVQPRSAGQYVKLFSLKTANMPHWYLISEFRCSNWKRDLQLRTTRVE
jgi:hypothetical protein